jgi:hypothetical protein
MDGLIAPIVIRPLFCANLNEAHQRGFGGHTNNHVTRYDPEYRPDLFKPIKPNAQASSRESRPKGNFPTRSTTDFFKNTGPKKKPVRSPNTIVDKRTSLWMAILGSALRLRAPE